MPRIQHKRGTSANLASVNPTPLAGELVWDSTENAIKIGDGATAWTSLAYVTATPRSHTHSADAITSGTVAYARLPVGSTASTVCAGDDARLTDARSPTAHKSTHATGGSDALSPSDIGAAPAASPTFTGTATFELVSTLSITALVSSWFDDDVRPKIFTTSGSAGDFNAEAGHLAMQPRTSTGVPRDIIFGGGNGTATERMRIRGTNGRVGIGTATPATLLDVAGVITVAATSGSAGSYLPSLTFSGDANTGFGQVSGQSDTASIFTAGHERLRVDSSGRLGIGTTPTAAEGIRFGQSLTGGTGANGLLAAQTVLSDVTSGANVFRTFVGTQASSFTLSLLAHFRSTANTFGAGSTVTTQIGFQADNTLTGATNNYGFRGDIADGTGRWNFYGLGTAPNYFAGNVGIGSGTTSPTAALDINSDTIRLRTAKTPASASDTGNAGDICWDADYVYICVSSNSWKRASLASW